MAVLLVTQGTLFAEYVGWHALPMQSKTIPRFLYKDYFQLFCNICYFFSYINLWNMHFHSQTKKKKKELTY